jgi:hypothetical protein
VATNAPKPNEQRVRVYRDAAGVFWWVQRGATPADAEVPLSAEAAAARLRTMPRRHMTQHGVREFRKLGLAIAQQRVERLTVPARCRMMR